jgi:hypothetical protein
MYLIELTQISEASNQVNEGLFFTCGKTLKGRIDHETYIGKEESGNEESNKEPASCEQGSKGIIKES